MATVGHYTAGSHCAKTELQFALLNAQFSQKHYFWTVFFLIDFQCSKCFFTHKDKIN